MSSAFNAAKQALANSTMLAHPNYNLPIQLVTDASKQALGAVLQQIADGEPQPLAFFSRKTSDAESRYFPYDLELLGVFAALKHFRYFLEGRKFQILTDQKPLTSAFFKAKDPLSARQQHQLAFISEFTTDIAHIPGTTNQVADALSRQFDVNLAVHTVAHAFSDIDLEELAAAQREDPDCIATPTAVTGLTLQHIVLPGGASPILCDTSMGSPRIYVPETWRKAIYNKVHNLSHPSGRATKLLITKKYVWHRIGADVTRWARECATCQQQKVARHTKPSIQSIRVPAQRFQHVHVDLVGPLPPSEGNVYILTVIDRTTRWPEAIPLPDSKAETVAQAFISSWISRFGIPKWVTSDRGVQFKSNLWNDIMKELGIEVRFTTAYHPEANGIVERFHQTLKAAIRCRLTDNKWSQALPWVLLGLRNTPKDDLGASSAEIMFGTTLAVPGLCWGSENYPQDELRNAVSNAKRFLPTPRNVHKCKINSFIPSSLKTAEYVFVRDDTKARNALHSPYMGPFKVLSKDFERNTFSLQLSAGPDSVAISRLKPAILSHAN